MRLICLLKRVHNPKVVVLGFGKKKALKAEGRNGATFIASTAKFTVAVLWLSLAFVRCVVKSFNVKPTESGFTSTTNRSRPVPPKCLENAAFCGAGCQGGPDNVPIAGIQRRDQQEEPSAVGGS